MNFTKKSKNYNLSKLYDNILQKKPLFYPNLSKLLAIILKN